MNAILTLTLSLLGTGLVILVLERLILPRHTGKMPFWRRTLLSVAPVFLFYLVFLMISYRPVFASGVCIATFGIVVVMNNAKYRALQEPLVYTDFALLREVINHPALYINYIGPVRLVVFGLVTTAFVVASIAFEPPLIDRVKIIDWLPSVVFAASIVGLIYAITRGPLREPFAALLNRLGPKLQVDEDVSDLSLLICLICYFFISAPVQEAPDRRRNAAAERILRAEMRGARRRLPALDDLFPETLPNIVLMQNESFFDARRLGASIDHKLLPEFDRLVAEARFRGHLTVPAWGANTMRTEHAVLTGLPNEALGYQRFNPYLRAAQEPTWSFVQILRMLGYMCICVHPHSSSFFGRDKVFPNLGFYRFVGIEEFADAPRHGPYVSDVSVAEKVAELLEASRSPTFVFVITMENHGKWSDDRFARDGLDEIPGEAVLGSTALSHYLRHLQNADRSIGMLAETLRRHGRPGVLGVYGDHLPSLPDEFARTGFDEKTTDYLVWTTERNQRIQIDVAAEMLGRLIFDAAFSGKKTGS